MGAGDDDAGRGRRLLRSARSALRATRLGAVAARLASARRSAAAVAADRDRLADEAAVLRHAFETTAADRDRLAGEVAALRRALAAAAHGGEAERQPREAEAGPSPPDVADPLADAAVSDVWRSPLARLAALRAGLRRALAAAAHGGEAERQPREAEAGPSPPDVADPPADAAVSDVWRSPLARLAALRAGAADDAEFVRGAIRTGYFTQLTAYSDAALYGNVVDWQLRVLARGGPDVHAVPAEALRLPLGVPEIEAARGGRTIVADCLRYLWYARAMGWPRPDEGEGRRRRTVLEIGGGYGGFARTLGLLDPRARFVLVDLPESLAVARAFLGLAFPDGRFGDDPADDGLDFVLVPADRADGLAGCAFDTAVNVFSMSEMPNEAIARYLDLVEARCRVEHLFLVNAAFYPATPRGASEARFGDWLLSVGRCWDVRSFEIDPEIHRCPYVAAFPNSVLVAGRRRDPSRDAEAAAEAAGAAARIRRSDWVALSSEGDATAYGAEGLPGSVFTERDLAARFAGPLAPSRFAAAAGHVGRFAVDPGIDGPFFALWNDLRLNRAGGSADVLGLLLSLMRGERADGLVFKEELFLARRLGGDRAAAPVSAGRTGSGAVMH
jgi:hypothetical protein